jgi:superfamily II DNA or RNA helicase
MVDAQMIFEEIFRGQTFGPRSDFEPFDWQGQCFGEHASSVESFVAAHEDNGDGEQHTYLIYAGTGSGKTRTAGLLASDMLNREFVKRVVVVSPNVAVCRQIRDEFYKYFNIELATFNKHRFRDGVGDMIQVYVLTYGKLIQDPSFHRRICHPDTLTIFDEIHHLGDGNEWGGNAVEAFGRVRFIVGLSGTPYRSDNTRIPYVKYESTPTEGILRFMPDYVYSLGRAIQDGVCREPVFYFHGLDDKTVIGLRWAPDDEWRRVTFSEKLSEVEANQRLRGAIEYGSLCREVMLRSALDRCRSDGRKVIIFLGGERANDPDAQHPAPTDAKDLLPKQLREFGITDDEFEVVTSTTKDAQDKIMGFGKSKKWILICINMVSEGTNIPEVSAEIHLSPITTLQTVVQRIGRSLRKMGPNDRFKDALVFMFADDRLIAHGRRIRKEIEHEIRIARRQRDLDPAWRDPEGCRYRPEAIGLSGGEASHVVFGEQAWPIEVWDATSRWMKQDGIAPTHLEIALKLMLKDYYERNLV